jgi:hypothetical protein
VEGWDTKKTWIVCFVVGGVGSFIWGILWTAFEKSIQDAFAISGFIVALTLLSIGLCKQWLNVRNNELVIGKRKLFELMTGFVALQEGLWWEKYNGRLSARNLESGF